MFGKKKDVSFEELMEAASALSEEEKQKLMEALRADEPQEEPEPEQDAGEDFAPPEPDEQPEEPGEPETPEAPEPPADTGAELSVLREEVARLSAQVAELAKKPQPADESVVDKLTALENRFTN